MKKIDFFESLSDIDDKYIKDARENSVKKRCTWIKGFSVAAALIICIGGVLAIQNRTSVEIVTAEAFADSYSMNIPENAENTDYRLVTNHKNTYGQVSCEIDGEKYVYRIAALDSGVDVEDMANVEGITEKPQTNVGSEPATCVTTEGGEGAIYWSNEEQGYIYSVSMERNASEEKLIKAAEPLENHAQVHEEAGDFDPEAIIGVWKYDQYDSYIEITPDGNYFYLDGNMKRSDAYEYKLMEDCIILYNEFYGEGDVLYFTKDGKLVDTGGDGLSKVNQ